MSLGLYASLMCADFSNLKREVEQLEAAGIDGFHCDVMDGSFVPNMSMGTKDVETVAKLSNVLVDVHLMLNDAYSKLDWFIDAGAELIYLHPENELNCLKSLMYLKEKGVKAGLAINPDIPFSLMTEYLHVADVVMIMTVNPGFAGQKFLDFTHDKIMEFVDAKEKYGYTVVLDGACSPEVVAKYHSLGVDGFVLGTSALFKNNNQYQENLDILRNKA